LFFKGAAQSLLAFIELQAFFVLDWTSALDDRPKILFVFEFDVLIGERRIATERLATFCLRDL
jgi:hypothetical protein